MRIDRAAAIGAATIGVLGLIGCNARVPEPEGREVEVASVAQAIELAPIVPVADTTIRAATPFASDGLGQNLGVTTTSIVNLERSLVRFDTTALSTAIGSQTLHSARLELTIQGVSAGWLGGKIEILRMIRTWPEGNGLLGNGPSWVCANDTNTTLLGNLVNNCSSANNWGMLSTDFYPRPFVTTATARAPIFTGGLGVVTLDVTADVQMFLQGEPNHGWIIAGTGGPMSGQWVNFGSRQSSNPPRLVLTVGPDECQSNPSKGIPGQCGCDQADIDSNLDGVADCFDALVTATADTTTRLAVPFGNDGTGSLLGVTSASVVALERTLVRVDQTAIDAARTGRNVDKAYLEVTIAGIALGWGGGLIDIHPMNRDWPEGTGLAGHGPSWYCADDLNTTLLGNAFNDCAPADLWGMEPWQFLPIPFSSPPTDSEALFSPRTTSVRFDVTADVQRFVQGEPNHGWLIKGREDLLSGQWVNFGSRETGTPPRLLLDLSVPLQITESESVPQGTFDAFGNGVFAPDGSYLTTTVTNVVRVQPNGAATELLPDGGPRKFRVDPVSGRFGHYIEGNFALYEANGTFIREYDLTVPGIALIVPGTSTVVLVLSTPNSHEPAFDRLQVVHADGTSTFIPAPDLRLARVTPGHIVYATSEHLVRVTLAGVETWRVPLRLRDMEVSLTGNRLIGVRVSPGSTIVHVDLATGALSADKSLDEPLYQLAVAPAGEHSIAATKSAVYAFDAGGFVRKLPAGVSYMTFADVEDHGIVAFGGAQSNGETLLGAFDAQGTLAWTQSGVADDHAFRPYVTFKPGGAQLVAVRREGLTIHDVTGGF